MYIEMSPEDSKCGITEFYDHVAMRRNYNVTDNTRYACSKIEVAENIADNIFDYCENVLGTSKETMGMQWVCYGPKANRALKDNYINIEEGFIYEEEGES